MDLSPNDIRNYEFSSQMRGYDREEVDTLLDQASEALEKVKQENLRLSMETDSLKSQLAGLRQFEDTIKSAAIDARRNADMTVANAKQEAELMLSRARAEAERLVGSQTHRLAEIQNQISKLELTKKSFIAKIRGVINGHLDLIDEIAKADIKKNLSEDAIEVTESTDVTRKGMETIASKTGAPEPIKTEEANAAESIVPASPQEPGSGEPGPTPEAAAQPTAEQSEPEQKPIDPELAAALQNYQTQQQPDGPTEETSASLLEPAPKPGQIVETTASAEDVPPGLIAKQNDADSRVSSSDDTDKVDLAPGQPAVPAEYGSTNVNTSLMDEDEQKQLSPENLAKELDNVAAEFEKEMDRAEKS